MKNLREFAIETYQDKIAFLPGEVIKGQLYVCFEEPIEMKSMKVFLYGEGQGAWLEQSRQTNKEKNINTNEIKTKEILINIGLLLFGYTDDKNTDKHEKGRYLYSFEFNLPKNLPCTFKSPPEKDLGYARYCLKTVISRPRKYDKITKLSITINERIESDRPDLMFTPGSFNEKSVSTACLPSGTLRLEGYLNQSYYCQGDDILITAIGENGSPKILKEMYAKLIRRVRYKARYGTNTYTTDRAHINGSRIPAQSKLAWRDEPLKVPAVGPTISGNNDIRVDYIVRLGMFEELGSEIHLDLPVIIGTIGTKDDEGKEEKQVEADVFDRNKNRYELKVIKAMDRNKHREVLKEKVEAANNRLTADISDEGLNMEFDLEEINIALDEEVEAGFDDEAFLKGLEDAENRSKSIGSKPLFDKEKRSHPTRSKSVESIKSSLRGSKNSIIGGELSKSKFSFNGSTGSIGGRKSPMSARSIGGSTSSMYGSKDDLKRSTSGSINGLGSSTSSLGSAKHEGRRVSLGNSPRGFSASAGSLRKPLNESDRLKYDTAKGMSASAGSLDKGAAKDPFGSVDSLEYGKGNVTSSKDSLVMHWSVPNEINRRMAGSPKRKSPGFTTEEKAKRMHSDENPLQGDERLASSYPLIANKISQCGYPKTLKKEKPKSGTKEDDQKKLQTDVKPVRDGATSKELTVERETCSASQTTPSQFKDNEIDVDEGYDTIERSKKDPKTERSRAGRNGDRPGNDQSRPPICIRPSASSSPAKIPLKKKSVGDKKNPIEERSRFIGDRQGNDQSRSPICERKDKPPPSDPLPRRGLRDKDTTNKYGVLKTSKPNSYVSIYKQKKESKSSPDISQNFTSKAKHTVSHNDSHDTTDVLPPNTDKTESDIILKKKTTPMKDVQKEILTSSAKHANNDDEYADNTSQQQHSDKDDDRLLEGYDMKPVSNSNRSTSKSRDHLPSSKDNSEDKLKKEKEEDTQQTFVPVNDTKHKATKGILKRKEAKQTYPGFHYHPIGNELQSPIPYEYKTNKLRKEPLSENSDDDFHSEHSSRTQSPIQSPLKLPNSPTKPPYSSVNSSRKVPVCSPTKRPQSSVVSSSNIPTAEVRGPILPYFGHIEQLDRKLKYEENRREVDTYNDEEPLAEVPEDFILPEAPRRNSSYGQTFPVKSQEFEFVLRPPYAVEYVTLEGPLDKVTVEYRVEELERDSTNDKEGQENKDDESKQIRDSKQKQNAKESPLTLPEIPTHPSLSVDTSKNMTLPKPPQKEEKKKLNDKKQNESFNIPWNYSTILRTPPMLKGHINKNEESEGLKDAWERKRNKSPCSTNDETVNQPTVKRSQSRSPNQMRRNKKLKPTATDENTISKTRSRSKSPREDQTAICEKGPRHVSNKVNPSNSTTKKAFSDESREFARESQALENHRLNKSSDKGKLKDGAKKLKTSSEGKYVNEETLNNLTKTRKSPRSGKTNLDHERYNKSSGALKSPRGDKRLKEGEKDVSKQAKKQPSHDHRIVIGGGLMFHSSPKKTLQSSKKTIQSPKKTQQTSQQKMQSPKKEPKKISRLAQNQAVKNKNKVEHSKLQKDVFDPISQSIGDKIEYKYISENDLKRDESTMEKKQRMEEEAWERKIKEYLNKNNGEGNFYPIPSTSCGYSVVPHRVRDDESHLIPSASVVSKMVCEENVAVRKKVQPSPSKKAPTSRVQVQGNKEKKSNTKPTTDTRPNEKEMDIIKSSRDKTTNDDPLKDMEERHLNQYESAENRKIKGVTHAAEKKQKENNITVTKRPKSDRRYHKKQDDSDEEEYFDQLLVTKKSPRSAVHPLSSKSSHNRSLPETTYAKLDLPVLPVKHPNWYVEEHPEEEDLLAIPHTIQAKAGGHNLFDSFECHEQTLGIIDANGHLRSNQELLHGNFENIEEISEEEEQRKRRIQQRKNKRFISDLQMIKHSRPASCPPAIGAREGVLEFFDHEYDDINGSETGTEYTSDGEEHIRKFSSADEEYPSDFESGPATGETTDQPRNDKSNKEIENSKPATVTVYASKRAPYKVQNSTNVEHGCFGYEEEVIGTYQYIEERPHKPTIDLSKSSYEPGSANTRKTHVEKQKKPSLEKTNSGVNNKRTTADVTPVKRTMRISVHNKPTVHRQNPDVEYLYEYAFE